MRSEIGNRKSKILIAGAGPAGSSLSIRLAQLGYEVTLLEREHCPRQKLCGEFISPECFAHFETLGVLDQMLDSGGDRVLETRFYETGGKSVAVPTKWFGLGDFALSLSRAEMDHRLLKRARDVGVRVLEGTMIIGVEYVDGAVRSVKTRAESGTSDIAADFFVDATGRSRVLSKFVAKGDGGIQKTAKPSLVGFKTHLKSADLPKGSCEIYSFAGGYAGLSHVEGDVSNICFLINSATVRAIGSDPGDIVERVVRRNRRADTTLREASAVRDWLAVAIDSFGTRTPAPAINVVTRSRRSHRNTHMPIESDSP
jgi:flavin-dependent dehydrogenase